MNVLSAAHSEATEEYSTPIVAINKEGTRACVVAFESVRVYHGYEGTRNEFGVFKGSFHESFLSFEAANTWVNNSDS